MPASEYRPLVLPERWSIAGGGVQYVTTHDPDTQAGRRAIYVALQECETTARDAVNQELSVVGLTFHGQDGGDFDGGEAVPTVAKISLADGSCVGTNSRSVVCALLAMLDLYRCPPTADRPWRLQIYTKGIGPGADGQPRSVVKVRDLALAGKQNA